MLEALAASQETASVQSNVADVTSHQACVDACALLLQQKSSALLKLSGRAAQDVPYFLCKSRNMASESSMEWWRERWADGTAFWHKEETNPNLFNNLHHLNEGSKKPEDAGLMFLPMCGKALDMKKLYDQGYRVFGIDCAEKAVREFFDENNIQYELKHDDRVGDVYNTPDGRLRVVCGDIFRLTPEIVGEPVTMIWDRGALGAVDKEMRKSYAKLMCSLVGPGARYLYLNFQSVQCVTKVSWA